MRDQELLQSMFLGVSYRFMYVLMVARYPEILFDNYGIFLYSMK